MEELGSSSWRWCEAIVYFCFAGSTEAASQPETLPSYTSRSSSTKNFAFLRLFLKLSASQKFRCVKYIFSFREAILHEIKDFLSNYFIKSIPWHPLNIFKSRGTSRHNVLHFEQISFKICQLEKKSKVTECAWMKCFKSFPRNN